MKKMTDEQLEEMGKMTKQALEQMEEAWKIAMKAMPLQSYEYRRICTAGNALQKVNDTLRIKADDREWTDEKLNGVFSFGHINFS